MCKEPGSLHSILITSKKLKSLKNNNNNYSPCISKRGEDAEQKVAPDIRDREVNTWSHDLPEQRLKNEAATGTNAMVGKLKLQLTSCWRLSVANPWKLKTSWRTSCWWRGYPAILGDLLPGGWLGSHSEHWRKKPLCFLQKEGKRKNLEICQVTLFLISSASGETNNQT